MTHFRFCFGEWRSDPGSVPGFHSDPPQGGGFGLMSIGRFFDHCSELVEQQTKNGLALAFGPAQALGVVVKDGAGGAALEAAPAMVIEFVGEDFSEEAKFR